MIVVRYMCVAYVNSFAAPCEAHRATIDALCLNQDVGLTTSVVYVFSETGQCSCEADGICRYT